ncbi:MAG: cation-translocating P-type ATPase [archaeon]
MAEYYSLSASEAIKTLKSSGKGLTSQEARKRLEEFGPNELKKETGATVLHIFLNQFTNALILLLVFAGVLSLALGEMIEAVAIFIIILLNAVLGFFQEYRAEKSIETLERMSAPTARVLRDGKEQKIPAREVVPGDILLLEAGDIVSAETRLVEVSSLQIDEASLTGESVPSAKTTEQFGPGTSVADQENIAFMGTTVTYGKGKGIVISTGMKTEFGKIAASLQETKETETPLQRKFSELARQIGIITIVLIAIVFVSGTIQGTLSVAKMLLLALVLTVSTIPNSLPLVVTVGLSMGTNRLAKKNMLVKKLSAAESLGAATIICSDKTGTITKNQMTITEMFYSDQRIKVSGAGYEPEGSFYARGKRIDPEQLELPLRIGCLCNNAKLVEKSGEWGILGDPTEGALAVLGKKGGLEEDELLRNFSFVTELPFDSDRKKMSVIFKNEVSKKTEVYVKGAPDLLLDSCSRIIENGKVRKLTKRDREKILETNDSFAGRALRVLALAYRELPASSKYSIESVEKDLIFAGLVGMIDPPRDGVRQAVKECWEAGIKVMVITGDHALTTKAVAQKIGLFRRGDIVLTGDEVEKMSDAELEGKIEKVRIIARALPIQKLRIVDILQKGGHIVAMTGDGVNDAPALKKADIGISMGITGTDVAKEVSKAILVDDNFATIVNAIAEGRNIYNTLIRSARFFLSCNTGEITAVFVAIMLAFPLPLLPLQILLMNMLTDNFPALGLGFEPREEGIMKRKPRDPKEKPITRRVFLSIIIFGLIMGLGTLFMFVQYVDIHLGKAQTVAFTTLVMFQMFAVMSSRTLYPSRKHLNPLSNMWLFSAVCLSLVIQLAVIYWSPLQLIFGTVPLLGVDWLKIIGISSMGFVMMEISKLFVGESKPQAVCLV